MAVFNGERYLREQLISIVMQLADEDEVIIVDDCSHDDSIKIVEDISDTRIQLFRNRINVGPSISFERAIAKAKGKYILLSDQDDVWRSDKVEAMCHILDSTEALLVVSDAQIIDTDRKVIHSSLFSLRQSGPGFWRNLYKNGFVGCCMAFRSDTKAFLIPFPLKAGMHDEWIGLCSSVAGHVIFCDKMLIEYRRHAENVSALQHGSPAAILRKRIKLLASVLRRLPRILKWRLNHS